MACLRLLAGPAAGTDRFASARPQVRGRGLSGRLMAAALADVGDAECVLEAQVQVAGIYAEFGFQRSVRVVEDGIPHVTMRRPPGRRSDRTSFVFPQPYGI